MKLIFCDMDGSLLNHRSKISPRTLETLIKLQEKGIGVILSSGRHINSLKKYGNMLHFEKISYEWLFLQQWPKLS